ncbi:hypothetical protein ACJIZ3_021641 [Penstemon smallii]|uniref:Rab-GAP TBC domain-containing protein n=1 Tax=Penstemon smallii TaxID=265156 RepID=A0ABD3SM95_9LAMI
MATVPIETTMPETTSFPGISSQLGGLRGVQWRIDLGILPSSATASIDDIRRVTANSRRRYAALRRQTLVDPHVPKSGSSSPDVVMDNPLSQNPDSTWGRFFRNAELEKMVDQDLTRLYPERGSYFQTSGCQSMLRRILLLWCLRHPEYGYRQGMHELLAPLLYVLHVDVERLSEVRKVYDDHFSDKFDGFSFHENDLTFKFDFKKFSDSEEDGNGFEKTPTKPNSLKELDPEIQTIVSLSDAYGAEGELGIVLSEKFMEHDAYSMFNSLMNGAGGVVAMADFFSPSPIGTSHTGLPPVIEASAALYHLLSTIDLSLHSHLVELGVEPQYFALRWLRVLFGREFSLEDLLVIWDEILARDNTKANKDFSRDDESNFGILESPRGAFITAFAVSMILNLRSSLLATENATACLQRLLNFPDGIKIMKLVDKAKSLQELAVDANKSNSIPINHEFYNKSPSLTIRSHSLSLDSTSPRTPLSIVPDSYWEEKWRDLHKEEEHKKSTSEEQVPLRRKGWSERVKLRLSRTESDPCPSKKIERTQIPKPSVRRNLLADLEKQLGLDKDKDDAPLNEDVSEDNSLDSSDQTSPINGNSDHENESGRSSVASNSCIDENDVESCGTPLPVSDPPEVLSSKCSTNDDSKGKLAAGIKERILQSGKFQWLRKFGRNGTNEGTSETTGACAPDDTKTYNGGSDEKNVAEICSVDGCDNSSGNSKGETCDSSSGNSKGETCDSSSGNSKGETLDSSSGNTKGETVDQNVMVSLRNLGQSMLENIQVIESVFQPDRGQKGSSDNLSKNGIVGKGQVTAMSALKELRKISNLLSEM